MAQQIFWIFIFLPHLVLSGPSQRGRCSLECYSRCMQSGTPSAVYCNCPVDKTHRPCSSVEERLQNAEVAPTPPDMRSEYVDSHTIKIKIGEVSGAFAYIFEYSTISTQPDDWYFAGASTTASLTFSILDPCRDYQFRVIAVIRSADPDSIFMVFRPRAIPVDLPAFVLSPQQMTVDVNSASADLASNTIKLYVKWNLPKGYTDADIYGYESPSLYPIQCATPEGELPQPKIEIVKGGARLAVSLPMSVLEARCRMWVEVKMLPRCVRLEPFIIQKNVEIDCEKSSELEVCSRDRSPACTEVVDIFGNKGKVKIMWEQPGDTSPLYYHVRYGPAELRGISPFLSWQLSTKRDVKVDSNVLSLTLHIPENQQFGVQVCGIYSEKRKRPKFGVVHVIPFECLGCPDGVENHDGPLQCGECGRIAVENQAIKKIPNMATAAHTPSSPVFGRSSNNVSPWKTLGSRTQQLASSTTESGEASIDMSSLEHMPHSPATTIDGPDPAHLGIDTSDSASSSSSSSLANNEEVDSRTEPDQTVFSMETDLVVGGNMGGTKQKNFAASGNIHRSLVSPISIEKAERINHGANRDKITHIEGDEMEHTNRQEEEPQLQSPLRYRPSSTRRIETTTTLEFIRETTKPPVEIELKPREEEGDKEDWVEYVEETTTESSTTAMQTESLMDKLKEDEIMKELEKLPDIVDRERIIDVERQMKFGEEEPENPETTTEEWKEMDTEATTEKVEELVIQKTNERVELTKELEESVKNLEKALAAEGRTMRSDLLDEQIKTLPLSTESTTELATTTTPSTTSSTAPTTETLTRERMEIKRIVENVENAEEDLNEKLSSLASSSEVRLHERSKKCMLTNGAICEFGCETKKSCYCPLDSHIKQDNGLCISRDLVSHTTCLPKRDINATWDAVLHNVMMFSKEAAEHIAKVQGREADRLWIEFGRVQPANVALSPSNLTLGGWVFADSKRSRMIQSIEKIYENETFGKNPFVFHVNSSVSADEQYGIRLCTYQSDQIENPFMHNWESETAGIQDKRKNVAQVVQLSPVHFTHGLKTAGNAEGSFWGFFFLIGKIIILLILLLIMTILIYLNCSRIKAFYDRKRTHYFRPFYIDPQIHVTEITSRCPSSERDNSVGYYDTKNYDTRSRMV